MIMIAKNNQYKIQKCFAVWKERTNNLKCILDLNIYLKVIFFFI